MLTCASDPRHQPYVSTNRDILSRLFATCFELSMFRVNGILLKQHNPCFVVSGYMISIIWLSHRIVLNLLHVFLLDTK